MRTFTFTITFTITLSAVRSELEAAFGAVREVRGVTGGCVSPSFHVTLRDGEQLFVKLAGRRWPADAFREEARSLERLRATQALVVPRVHGFSEGWLALEWLEPARRGESGWTALGTGLARLHRTQEPWYGWEAANYIGPLPQPNQPTMDWATFWRERRLQPQLVRAAPRLGRETLRDFERLFDDLADRLSPAGDEGASLLHGDLWSGNVHMCTAGAGVVDPASYYGHREVDLAMAALFGAFPRRFEEAYSAEWPLLPGASTRRAIYQLYYLLVHVVLFGGGYAQQTAHTLKAALK